MTTKEKIIRQAIAECEAELAGIKALLAATPASDIITGRQQAQRLLAEYETSDPRLAHKIGVLADEEKRFFEIAAKQQNSVAFIDRQVKLESELQDLHKELWHIDRKNPYI